MNILTPFFLKNCMSKKVLSGKKYFYALGMSCRERGISKDAGMAFFGIESALPYARIAFDAGFRGLAL